MSYSIPQELSFHVFNPSSQPLQVELILLNQLTELPNTFHTLSDKFNIDTTLYDRSKQVYTIKKTNHQNDKLLTSYQKFPKFILPPHGNQSLQMEFSPISNTPSNGLLLLRNNLTVFDFIKLEGTASRSFVTVGGVYPSSPTPLIFKYTEAMMEACANVDCECEFVQIHMYNASLHVLLVNVIVQHHNTTVFHKKYDFT